MVSTFFGLNIAASGLRAANAALNTTGNNISNVNTEGYSRQVVDTSPTDALRTFTRYGSAGAGVDTLAIERVRDQFYDNRYRQNETRLGEYEMKNYFNKNIETYLKDDGVTGFSALFDKMQAALQTVMTNGGSTTSKTTYVSQVQAMTEYFNTMYANLQREQSDANDELKIRVSRINSIAQELATINGRINMIEMTGTTANELRDKRDLMLDELSKIVDIETRETDVMDVSQPDRKTGATRFEVFIAGGQSLVDGSEYRQLLCVARQEQDKVNQNDVGGLYDVKWIKSNYQEGDDYIGDFDLGNANIGGELGGIIQMRDGNNGQAFHGFVSKVDREIDTVTDADGKEQKIERRLVTVRADKTKEYMRSIDHCTVPSAGQITVDNVRYQYDSWAYREVEEDMLDSEGNQMLNEDGSVKKITHYEYTFHLVSGKELTDEHAYDSGLPVQANEPYKTATQGCAQIGADVNYEGIPYYLEQINEFARIFANEVNDIMRKGYPADNAGKERAEDDPNKDQHGYVLLTGNRLSGTTPPQYTDEEIGRYEIDTTGKAYESLADFLERTSLKGETYLTAGNFAVSFDVRSDVNLLSTRLDVNEGVDELRALQELYNMCSTKEIFRSATSGEFLDKVLTDVAMNASNSQTNEDTYLSLQKTIENQRSSISGVDEDEEAANLVKYQNAYTLASKMIQTLTEIYDRLINQTGV